MRSTSTTAASTLHQLLHPILSGSGTPAATPDHPVLALGRRPRQRAGSPPISIPLCSWCQELWEGSGFAAAVFRGCRAGYGAVPPASRVLRIALARDQCREVRRGAVWSSGLCGVAERETDGTFGGSARSVTVFPVPEVPLRLSLPRPSSPAPSLSPRGWSPRAHRGEVTRDLPFELVDDVPEQTGTGQRRLRELPSRVGVYFVLALGMYPRLGMPGCGAS